MPLRDGSYFLCSLNYLGVVVLAIAVETAKAAFTLLAASDALTLGDLFATIWANILIPEFKGIAPL
jgi:hypothetical protein